MPHHDKVTVRRARAAELAGALAVQYEAFGRVAIEHGVPPEALAPSRETLEDLVRQYNDGTVFYIAVTDSGRVVGAVRAALTDGVVEVGRLVVAVGWLRQGIATKLMRLLEAEHCHCERYRLFTGSDAKVALAFYHRLGYRPARTDDSGPVPLVWLEKPCDAEEAG